MTTQVSPLHQEKQKTIQMTQAAILVDPKKPLIIDEIEIPPLKPGQVLVKVHYSGVCHTQLLEVRGHRGEDRFLPHCLGHEGSGVVVEIGPKVEKVQPDDPVILSWIKGKGADIPGTVYPWGTQHVNAGAITTLSQYSVISENRLTKIPKDIPMKEAALLGCAAPTGLGVIFNTAQPRPGQSLAVFGCGGVGLCAIQGADIVGCAPIIAIDIFADKLVTAKQMGAHYTINASEKDALEEINKICSLDFAIEATGNPSVMRQAIQSVRPQGGRAVIVGNAHFGTDLTFDPRQLNMGKQILGSWGGDTDPDIHFPRYCNLIRHGRLNLQPLTTKTYSLNKVEQAFADLEQGSVLRPLIYFPD